MTNIPWDQNELDKSLGKGLGQQTGGGSTSDSAEASRIIDMIEDGGGGALIDEVMGNKSATFFLGQLEKRDSNPSSYYVTGKQLFWLRDIKDRLVEGGHI